MQFPWLNRSRIVQNDRIEAIESRLLTLTALLEAETSARLGLQSQLTGLRATLDRQDRRLLVVEGWLKAHAINLDEHDKMKKDVVRVGNLLRSLEVRLESEVAELERTDEALAERVEAWRLTDPSIDSV
jgi:hypothetical protein